MDSHGCVLRVLGVMWGKPFTCMCSNTANTSVTGGGMCDSNGCALGVLGGICGCALRVLGGMCSQGVTRDVAYQSPYM